MNPESQQILNFGQAVDPANFAAAAAQSSIKFTAAAGTPTWVQIAYLFAAILFIYGLKGLTHPRTAVRGNLLSALGMFVAVVVTLIGYDIIGWPWLIAGLLVGSAVGWWLAIRVEMTAMPEMVALFNGFGGLASLVVAGAALAMTPLIGQNAEFLISTGAAGLIGSVTFTGSLVAFGKLRGLRWIPDGPIFSGQSLANAALFGVSIILCIVLIIWPEQQWAFWMMALVIAAALGITLTQPIGGADMPVVIALLNSYSGLAAAATGFVISNSVLIIAGSLVGASGLILTSIMCKAMNRSLPNVIFGAMGAGGEKMDADEIYKTVKATSADEIAMILDGAQRVAIVPGYGLAVSQAQHAVKELMDMLEDRDIEVIFGVHPVAGRMPGHMNVLLAEADIPYDKLLEMDQINSEMDQVDVTIVVGANDVVNPVARDENSPIAGMPIIDVDRAKTCVVIKRSLSPGFAGIPNPLFALENTLMFFNDGKKAFNEMIQAVKEG